MIKIKCPRLRGAITPLNDSSILATIDVSEIALHATRLVVSSSFDIFFS